MAFRTFTKTQLEPLNLPRPGLVTVFNLGHLYCMVQEVLSQSLGPLGHTEDLNRLVSPTSSHFLQVNVYEGDW